jgi:cysteine desulfurase
VKAPPSIYFDYNATTPLDERVQEAMLPFFTGRYGNPSSVHHIGRQARAALDEAREQVAAIWRCRPSEVVFTSGGTESNNLALLGVARFLRKQGAHIITSEVEHPAVLHCCRHLEAGGRASVTYLPVDSSGQVNLDDLAKAFRPETILVSIMAANNETGTLQPVSQMGALCRERRILFHTDAVQWFGKEPFDSIHQFNADLVSACAHKFHGPKGAGALFVRSPQQIEPLLFGGSHENERRAGTENLPAIVGLAQAMIAFVKEPVFPKPLMFDLTKRLERSLEKISGVSLQGSRSNRLANTVSFSVAGTDSISLLAGLDLKGVCASSGSACSSGSLEPSHVLRAMGVPPSLANSFVRFSLGRHSTAAEVEFVEEVLPEIIDRCRRYQ